MSKREVISRIKFCQNKPVSWRQRSFQHNLVKKDRCYKIHPMKEVQEWSIEVPWGKLALQSWGDPEKPPVLLVHGYMDSLATFEPMMGSLPDEYYYVACDTPGHGKSTAFPTSSLLSHLHMVEVLRLVIEHMQWRKFFYIGHSMASFYGLYYNAIYPRQMVGMVLLDPVKPLGFHGTYKHDTWYPRKALYYDHYEILRSPKRKLVTLQDSIRTVMKQRDVDYDLAAILNKRNIERVGDKYRSVFDPKIRQITSTLIPKETFQKLMIEDAPPSLYIVAKENYETFDDEVEWGTNLVKEVLKNRTDCSMELVEGGHSLHITNSRIVASIIAKFLSRKVFSKERCKL